MTFSKFVETETVKTLQKKTNLSSKNLYRIRNKEITNMKLSTVRQLLEEMLRKGYTETELFNMIMREE
jgi:Fe2+ or Zn2+ uptake regulation protein